MFGIGVAVAVAVGSAARALAEAEAMKRKHDAHRVGTYNDPGVVIDLAPGDVRVVEEPKLLEEK